MSRLDKSSLNPEQVNLVRVNDDSDGQRVDNFLMSALGKLPRALVYRIIRKGEVRVNRKRVKPDTRLASGDEVRIPPVRLPQQQAAASAPKGLLAVLQSNIVYEDDALLAVNKPQGLAVHGGSGISLGLIESLRQLYPDQRFLELVHRLDRDTSGIILVAKKRSALVPLQKMLVNKNGIRKRYLALVHGHWSGHLVEVQAPLKKLERQSGERIMVVDGEGKASHTRYRLNRRGTTYSLVEAEPVTGRTHQIRVHCQFEGHAISGDEKYRDTIQQTLDEQHGVRRLMLHALSLQFRHPISGDRLNLRAEPDDDFKQILEREGCGYQG